jgi:hypothetical protein
MTTTRTRSPVSSDSDEEFNKLKQQQRLQTWQSPVLRAAAHVLQPNGSILGRQVAECIVSQFPTFCSAIPTKLIKLISSQSDEKGNHHEMNHDEDSSENDDDIDVVERPSLASIDGRCAISHKRILDFVTNDFGPALHQLGFGKGDRIALVLPNGPELVRSIDVKLPQLQIVHFRVSCCVWRVVPFSCTI